MNYDFRNMAALKPSLIVVAFAAAALIAARPQLEQLGLTEDLTAAILLTLGLTGLALHRRLILGRRLGWPDLLLSAAGFLILALVILKETGIVPLPSLAIWLTGIILFILAIGYTDPPRDGEAAAP